MDIKEYISSGILESYVLRLTSPAEDREVERYALEYPEIKSEIASIEKSLSALAENTSKTPPIELKDNIFAKIRALDNQYNKIIEPKTIPLPIKSNEIQSRFSWWAAAAITLFLISSGINVILYSRWKSAEGELATLNNEKEILADQFKTEKTNFEQTAKDLNILKQPGNRIVTLKGSQIAPSALAVVYWNKVSHDVYLNISTLPDAPADKQYQLWAIVDGKPVDAGMLSPDYKPGLLQKMNNFENAQAFAITLEKKGGSPTPNLDALYLIGNI